jgi:hypothetical protein
MSPARRIPDYPTAGRTRLPWIPVVPRSRMEPARQGRRNLVSHLERLATMIGVMTAMIGAMTGEMIATTGVTNATIGVTIATTGAMTGAMTAVTIAMIGVTIATTGAMTAVMIAMTGVTIGETTAAMTSDPVLRIARPACPGIAGDVSRFTVIVLLGVGLLACTRGWAASADALSRFAEATAAFEAEDFSRARAMFEQALEAGMEGPAIHYNIGAAAYRAGDLPRAERAFQEVARTPQMAALAHYNLGVVALDRRDEREARDWFERVAQSSSVDQRLRLLATRRLEELPRARAAGTWSWYARGGAGYDDNIALRSDTVDSSATGEKDSFRELTLAGSFAFGAWRLDAGAGSLDYSSLDDFNQRSFFAGAVRGFRLDRWRIEVGLHGSQNSFGGEVFERQIAPGVLATRMFSGGDRLRARLRIASVEGQGLFSGLTGDRTELGVYYDKAWRSWYFATHTRAEFSASEDPIFESRLVQLGAEARYAFSPLLGFSMGVALRRTTRPALSESVAGWDDDRVALQLGATRAFGKQAQVLLRYEHERNDSPVTGFDYDRNRALASVEFWY